MTSVTTGAFTATGLPDYTPIPWSALGPALSDQGYYVGHVERILYWATRANRPAMSPVAETKKPPMRACGRQLLQLRTRLLDLRTHLLN